MCSGQCWEEVALLALRDGSDLVDAGRCGVRDGDMKGGAVMGDAGVGRTGERAVAGLAAVGGEREGGAQVGEEVMLAGAGGVAAVREGAATVVEGAVAVGGGLTAAQLGRLRELIVAANPDAVPELIGGDDFEALLASADPARAAFARVRETATRGLAAGVPRGGGTREFDPAVYAGLSPEGKIALGIGRVVRGTGGGGRGA